MAMMDDPDFLVAHIRNSYVTSDDTGMCEVIMESEEFERHKRLSGPVDTSDSGMEGSDHELSHSYDILPDMDYGAHRRRSNTAVRLEKLKKEKKSQVKVKHIPWKDIPINTDDCDDTFEKKQISRDATMTKSKNKTSLLSEMIANYGVVADNPFLEYSKFDGRINIGAPSKRIDIYLMMASPRDRPFPMTVVMVANGPKVQDLIGYTCWQYTSEGREPVLISNVNMYALHIAEDNGEVDTDFPCLNVKEPISKFGFTKLALVEKEASTVTTSTDSVVVTVNIPDKGFSKLPIDDLDIQLKDILDKVLKKRKIVSHHGISYNLERQNQPGRMLDLELALSAVNTFEFCLVRQNSCRGDLPNMEPYDSLSSQRYQTFVVSIIHKLRANTDVQLGISGSKVDIDPLIRRNTAKMFRFKSTTIFIDAILSCDILEEKPNGRTSVRLVYISNNEQKQLDFEAGNDVSYEIQQKINNILEWRVSTSPEGVAYFRDRRFSKKRLSLFT